MRLTALACVAAAVSLTPAARAMPVDAVAENPPGTVSLGDTAAAQARAETPKALDTALAQEQYFRSYGTPFDATTWSPGTTGGTERPAPVTVTNGGGDAIAWPTIVIAAGGALLLGLAAFAAVHTGRRVRRAPLGG
jgi:hypothetical protein